MPWPIPQPADIAARAAALFESTLVSPDGTPIDASDPNTVLGVTARITGMTAFGLYLYQSYLANELWPDTAQDNLDRIAGIWGLTRIAPAVASGSVSVTGTANAPLPSGIALADALGNTYVTTGAVDLAANGTGTLPVNANAAGAQGNLSAGTVLTVVSAVSGLAPQEATVLAPGFSGGAPAETDTALRVRVIARIRQRGRGGSVADYEQWAESASALVAYTEVDPDWAGPGSVGVFIAGAGPSALTSADVAVVNTALQAQRPVTAKVYVNAATLVPLSATIHLNPDTTANRAAATTAFAAWIATDAAIGGTLYMSRLDAALAAADGEFSHERIAPTADVTYATGTIASVGTLAFV